LDEASGYLDLDSKRYVEIDPRYYRPTEVDAFEMTSLRPSASLAGNPQFI